jgi:hypothetical protein
MPSIADMFAQIEDSNFEESSIGELNQSRRPINPDDLETANLFEEFDEHFGEKLPTIEVAGADAKVFMWRWKGANADLAKYLAGWLNIRLPMNPSYRWVVESVTGLQASPATSQGKVVKDNGNSYRIQVKFNQKAVTRLIMANSGLLGEVAHSLPSVNPEDAVA